MAKKYVKRLCIESVDQFLTIKDTANYAIITDTKVIPKKYNIISSMPFNSVVELIERRILFTVNIEIVASNKKEKPIKVIPPKVFVEPPKFNIKDVFK